MLPRIVINHFFLPALSFQVDSKHRNHILYLFESIVGINKYLFLTMALDWRGIWEYKTSYSMEMTKQEMREFHNVEQEWMFPVGPVQSCNSNVVFYLGSFYKSI